MPLLPFVDAKKTSGQYIGIKAYCAVANQGRHFFTFPGLTIHSNQAPAPLKETGMKKKLPLSIKDLPHNKKLDRKKMSAVRGGQSPTQVASPSTSLNQDSPPPDVQDASTYLVFRFKLVAVKTVS